MSDSYSSYKGHIYQRESERESLANLYITPAIYSSAEFHHLKCLCVCVCALGCTV